MSTRPSLEDWVNVIAQQGLPTLSSTIQAISKIDADSDMPVDQLADYIKQDPGLTAHILRHTQGAYRVPLKGKNNTVNRAIVMLGFNEVKSLCFSLSVLEDLLHGSPRSEFLAQLGTSFHAAIQARGIGFLLGERNCEEIFTAALLSKLGNLTFWSLGGENAAELSQQIINNPQVAQEDLEIKSLGFSLKELTESLSISWKIDSYIVDSSPDQTLKACVDLGYELADNAVLGWDHPKLKETIEKIAEKTSLDFELIKNAVRDNSFSSIRYALGFGIPGISDTLNKINKTAEIQNTQESEKKLNAEADKSSDKLFTEPDDSFLLKTIKGLGTLLEAGTTINELVKISLEGMHRGLAFDRAIFCLLSPNRKFLMPKLFINSYSRDLSESLKIEIDSRGIFGRCLFGETPIWVPEGLDQAEAILLPANTASTLKDIEFIVAPIIVNAKPIGLFYVDRGIRKNHINQEDFDSFKQIVFQVRLALQHLHASSQEK